MSIRGNAFCNLSRNHIVSQLKTQLQSKLNVERTEGCGGMLIILPIRFCGDTITSEFKELIEYYSEKKLELLVGRDANAHYTAWGNSNVNPREEGLCQYLMAQGLLVQNKGNAPTFITRVRQEIFDHRICSIGVQKLIHGWRLEGL